MCSPNPCKNGGLCKEMNGVATCECPPRYEGNFCESKFMITLHNNFAILSKLNLECKFMLNPSNGCFI